MANLISNTDRRITLAFDNMPALFRQFKGSYFPLLYKVVRVPYGSPSVTYGTRTRKIEQHFSKLNCLPRYKACGTSKYIKQAMFWSDQNRFLGSLEL